MTTKITLNNIADTALATLTGPKVTTIVYPGTETATDIAGGATINLTGGGFQSGCSVLVASTASSVVTFISSTQISFIAPALAAGTYVIYVINPDGGTAISIPGVSYSGTPNWTTTAGTLGNAYETGAISATLTATGDAPITYTLASGTLPTGSTLASNGTLSGTAVATASATTYTFTVTAKDAQNQTTNRSFSLTINPDVVTWVSPADSTTYTVAKDTAISNVTMSATSAAGGSITYTADTLPTGLSITGANIVGTPTIAANTSTTLTATSTATRAATRTINWVVNVGNDPYFEYTTLLLQGASTTFVDDASTNNFGVSIFGDTKPNSFNPYTPGYYSNQFTAQGQYLTFGTSSTLALGTGSFTVELWLNLNAYNASTSTLIDWRTAGNAGLNAPSFSIGANGILDVYLNILSGVAVSSSSAIPLNTWTHIACVRNGTALTLYFNGVSVGTGTSAVNCSIETFRINDTQGTYYSNCSISNLRIVKGTAVYTSAFTPSTTPLTAITNTVLLTCQSNRFIDNSTNNFTVTVGGTTQIKSFDPFIPNSSYSTYGSGYFDGTGDYLSIPNNVALQLTANFTIEFYMYATILSGRIIVKGNNASNDYSIDLNSNGTFGFNNSNGVATSTGSITVNSWNHVALTRNGSSCTWWINGVSSGTFTYSNSLNNTNAFWIGQNQNSGLNFQGYLTDVRVVKDTAVYTTSFTPPSAPLTAIANTSLLTLQNNQSATNSAFLDNSTNNFVVTRAGNTTQGTFSPYGGNWSNYFDGASDAIRKSGSGVITASGDVTIECWIYPLTSTVVGLFDGGPGEGDIIRNWGSNKISKVGGEGTGATFTVTPNTWQHFACTFTGGNIKVFINGSLNASGTYASGYSAGSNFDIGTINGGVDGSFNGYISNFRVTKSVLYTTTFTPSTTPLTAISGTSLLTCQSNRFIDNSINNYTITKVGGTTVQRFSPFNPLSLVPTSYGWNLYTSGSFQVQTVTKNRTLSSLSTGAFTVEGWYYPTSSISSKNARIISLGRDSAGSNTSWDLYISNGSALVWQRINSTATTYSANYTFNLNTWYHVVACRDGSGNLALFVNGTRILLQANETTNYDYVASSNDIHYIGATYNGTAWSYALGYYSNIRVIKGATAYDPTQSTLTVPTTPLTVTAQTSMLLFSNTGSDLAGNYPLSDIGRYNEQSSMSTFNPFGYTSATTEGYTVSTIGGSAYFDGTGDYLTMPTNSVFSLSGAFTFETWLYPTAFSNYKGIWSNTNTINSTGLHVGLNAAGNIFIYSNSSFVVTSSNAMVLNTWNHVVVVRNSGIVYIYINGVVSTNSWTTSTAFTNAACVIGTNPGPGTEYYFGYISDARLLNGTVLYTNNFVPPTAPLTAIQNSTLLLSMTSAGISDAAMMNNLETIGDAKLSHAVSKFGGTSMSFDGTGDYLSIPSSVNFTLGTGDFTIECWIYLVTLSNDSCIIDGRDGTGTVVKPLLFVQQTLGYTYFVGGAGRIQSGTPVLNSWKHVAVVRSSGSTKMYVDGAQIGSTYADSNNYLTCGFRVGYFNDGVTTTGFNGYIDDLRITKGYARYTANFTAPTSEFKTF